MRRGINLGNALDAGPDDPRAWAVDGGHLSAIRDAGFDTVRLPVAWSKHAAQTAPFEISPAFLAEVDGLIDAALARELEVVIDVHHYDELCADPDAHRARFLALWAQIGERYAGLPTTTVFELLNEPHGRLSGRRWNELLADALAVVRDSNPERDVVAGPAHRNRIAGLAELELPDDERLIVTIHYYLPLSFTHQGARWVPHAVDRLGTRWARTPTGPPYATTSPPPSRGQTDEAGGCSSGSSARSVSLRTTTGWPGRDTCGRSPTSSTPLGAIGTWRPTSASTTLPPAGGTTPSGQPSSMDERTSFVRGAVRCGHALIWAGISPTAVEIAAQIRWHSAEGRSRRSRPVSQASLDRCSIDLFSRPIRCRLIAGGQRQRCSPAERDDLRSIYFIRHPDGTQLIEIARLVDSGQLRPQVGAVYPLAQAREAFTAKAAGGIPGRVILQP